MSSDAYAWDRLAAGIQSVLPEWARHQGYGTYAVAAYAYLYLLVVLSGLFYAWDNTTLAIVFGALALVAWLLGSYYKGAAKIRVKCNHCGSRARGKNICPNCSELTYTGDSE